MTRGRGHLYLGNCRQMREVADDSVDLVVTNPPYWIDPKDTFLKAALLRREDGQIPDTYPAFLDGLQACFAEVYRTLKPGRLCCVVVTTIVGGQMIPFPFHLVGRLEAVGFHFYQDILWRRWRGWDKRAGNFIKRPFPGYFRPNRAVEYVLVFQKPGGKPMYAERTPEEREASRVDIDRLFIHEIAGNIWHILPVMPRASKHPCPFPEEQAYRLISLYSYRGETVLDPFLGSGTTVKVARLLGRDYLGYEVTPQFPRVAQEHLLEPHLERQAWLCRFESAASAEAEEPSGTA